MKLKLALMAVAVMGFVGAAQMAAGQTAAQMRALQTMAHPQAAQPNGVEATTVPIFLPSGLAYDAAGNLYVAAANDHIVRKVDLTGIITTVAGTGEQGFAGDGGAATSALLDSPTGIAVNAAGTTIYIGDTHNNRVRVVTGGTITTFAGTGVAGFGGDGAAATAALLNYPTALSLDAAGNLYVADTNNNRVRKVVSGTINTVAGNGEQIFSGDGGPAIAAGLDSPNGVAADTLVAGKFYISDTHNQRIRVVDAAGNITTLVGTGLKAFGGDGGVGTSASVARPRGLAVDASGKVFFADSDNNRVRTVTGTTVATIAGNGEQGFSGDTGLATGAAIDTPRAAAVNGGGTVAFSDSNNARVRAVSPSGIITTVIGVSPTGAESLILSAPVTIVYGSSAALTATFSNNGNTATGSVAFSDGATALGSGTFASNVASLTASGLKAGVHTLVATYAGDANNAAIASGVSVLTVTPLAITATANAATIQYGQAIPALTGTLTGVLPADAANVTAVFATTATATSPVGTYPITVTLTGSAAANYSVTLSGTSGSLIISKAATTTVLTSSTATPTLGVAFTLTATVASTTSGVPTGSVSFIYNGASIGTGTLAAGVATLSTSVLPLGVDVVTAVYAGDTNFLTSTSAGLTETVIVPPFSFFVPVTSPSDQTIAPGGTATYQLNANPLGATFPAPVTFTVSGLPTGATYTLTPASIAAGAGPTQLVFTITVPNPQAQLQRNSGRWLGISLGVLLLPFAGARNLRSGTKRAMKSGKLLALMLMFAAVVGGVTGCGAGGFFGQPQQSYSVVITATSGTVQRTATVTLTVQ